MVKDLELGIKIVMLPIIRNSEGCTFKPQSILNEEERMLALHLPIL